MEEVVRKLPIEFTNSALERMRSIIDASRSAGSGDLLGIKISTVKKGCGGNSYKMELCSHRGDHDDVFSMPCGDDVISVIIDKKSMFYLLGTKVDYLQKELESGFEFYNDKETGRCGCGRSFYA